MVFRATSSIEGALLSTLNALFLFIAGALMEEDQVKLSFDRKALRISMSRAILEKLEKDGVRFASLLPQPQVLFQHGSYTVTGERLESESNEAVLIFRFFYPKRDR